MTSNYSDIVLRTLFVDFNAYFASVEQQLRPELRGLPVGVVPVMAETSSCIAASYEAKRFGIKTGTGVREARRLCPGIAIVQARPELYVQMHERAVALIDTIAPVLQVVSIDEMECELTGRWREQSRAVDLAHRIKRAVNAELGACMRVSVGIAPNTLLGKLASDMQKPDGLTVIAPDQIPAAFAHLSVSAINGVGPRMARRLSAVGIDTAQALFDAPRSLLHTVWGGVAGDEMYDKIRGVYYAPRMVDTKSLGHSHVLPPDLRNADGAYSVLTRLTQKAAMRLRKQGFFATSMSVHVRCIKRTNEEIRTGYGTDARFWQTQDTAFFLHTLASLWEQVMQSAVLLHHKPLSVGMVFAGLVPAANHTPSLFDAPQKNVRDPKHAELLQTLDRVNKQYGKNTLYYAASHGALDRAPMRIAFTRIPDVETEG